MPLARLTRAACLRAGVGAAWAGAATSLAACEAPFAGKPATSEEIAGKVTVWAHTAFNWTDTVGGEIMADTMAKHPKLQIVVEPVTDGSSIVRAQKLIAATAGGNPPDVTHVGTSDLQGLGKAGIIQPVDRYLKASRVVKQSDLWPEMVKDMTWKGQQYGMPWGPDLGILLGQFAALRSAGINTDRPPTTWEEFEEHVRRLYREDEPGKPTRIAFHALAGQAGPTQWLIPFWQQGGELLSADGTKVTINNEKGIAALQWIERVFKAQGGYDSVLTLGQNQANLWIAGAAGYWFANVAAPSQSQPLMDAMRSGLQFFSTYWPIPRGGKRANIGGAHAFCISAQTKAPAGAWAVLENLSSEENNLKFAVFYNRIPIRVKTAQSAAFHKNDTRLKLAVEEMDNRKSGLTAPGGAEATPVINQVALDVVMGKKSVTNALDEGQKAIQAILDNALR